MSGAMYLMLKKSADRRQREALAEAFERADKDKDGFLSVDEYHRILAEHGIECSRDEIVHIMQVADKDHDGLISREEFLGEPSGSQGFSQSSSARRTSAKAEKAFELFDKNHDGFVTKDEMLNMSKKMTKEQVDAVFSRIDENHDGKLTLAEFNEMMQHNRHNQHRDS